MIKSILIFLAFLAIIIAAPVLIGEKGYILIAIGEWTIESTVVTAGIMFVLALLVLLLVIAVLRGTIKLGSKGWQQFAFASRHKALARFQQGFTALLLGDHAKAETLLAKSTEGLSHYHGLIDTAWLGAATAANHQGLASNTKHYLTLVEQNSQGQKTTLESLILKTQLLVNDEKFEAARKLLDDNHKLIGHDHRLMSEEIKLCLIEQRFQAAIDNLNSARKLKGISAEQVYQWELEAFSGQFNQLITKHSLGELETYWQQLSRKIRKLEAVILAYANVLAAHHITDSLIDILVPVFAKSTNERFINQAKQLPIKNAQPLISALEKQLKKNQNDAKLLSALAHVALNSGDYNLASKAFTKLFEQEKSPEDLRAYAKVLEHNGDYQQANRIYNTLIA